MKRTLMLPAFYITMLSALLLIGCASTETTEAPRQAEYHNTMGLAFLNEGKVQLAYVEFHKALKAEPANKDFIYNLGVVYLQLEEYGQARDQFLKAVRIDPAYSDAWNSLGVCYMQLGEWRPAIDAFKKAIANPFYRTPEKAYYSMGMALYRLGDYDQALNAFKDSLKRARDFPHPYYGMALTLNKLGRYSDAADVMDRAIQVDTSYNGDHDRKAEDLREQLYTAKGEDEKDIQDYLEIMKY